MAELAVSEVQRILAKFLPEYNVIHNTHFTIDDWQKELPDEIKELSEDCDIDIYLKRENKDLMLQITRAVGCPEKEYKEAKYGQNIKDEIKRILKDKGINVALSIWFKKYPEDDRKIALFIGQIVDLVKRKTMESSNRYFSIDLEDDFYALTELNKYLKNIELMPCDDVSIGSEVYPTDNMSHLDDSQIFFKSLIKKINNIKKEPRRIEAAKNIIFVAYYESSPFVDHGIYLNVLKERCSSINIFFKEAWIISLWEPDSGAWKIK